MTSGDRVEVRLVVEAGEDDRERHELTTKLRRELLRLDVDSIERPSAGDAPPGTRAVDLAQIGELIVIVGTTAGAIGSLVAAVRSWLTAAGAGTVKIQIGDDTLEIPANLSEDQKPAVAAWIKAHEPR